MNPHFGKASTASDVTLGISEFRSDIKDDKVAIVIKSRNSDDRDEIVVWYSERSFIANFIEP